MFNYQKICSFILDDLSPRTKEVISRRFALLGEAFGKGGTKGETLESIGQTFGITRERVRQIEKAGLLKIKPKIGKYQKVFHHFTKYLKSCGNLKKESVFLDTLGEEKQQAEVYFLLTLNDSFKRFEETEELHALWTIDENSFILAKEIINFFYSQLKNNNRLLSLKEFKEDKSSFPPFAAAWEKKENLFSYLEISKKIQQNKEGLFGLSDWPEINPRTIKDKAYLVLKKNQKPLHFSRITDLIEGGALVQTVHNELIKDPKFILVGRGIYALKEWGYEPGYLKDIILKVLKESQKPLTKQEILSAVFEQRMVKENTVLLNLSNKKYFLRDDKGRYLIRED